MGYQQALEATGATIVEFQEFGSYQGNWIAILSDGRFVSGAYGSCSGCDAFQAEFDFYDQPSEENGKYYRNGWAFPDQEITKDEYERLISEYKQKLCTFGQTYMNDAETYEEIEARYKRKADEEYSWDDDKEIHEWIVNHKPAGE